MARPNSKAAAPNPTRPHASKATGASRKRSSTTTSKVTKSKRKRPSSVTSPRAAEASREQNQQLVKRKRGRPRTSHASSTHNDEPSTAADRREESEDDDGFSGPPQPRRDFSFLKARQTRIQQDVILNEWKQLPPSIHPRIRDVLVTAKRSTVRPSRSSKKADEADAAVESLQRRILSRLPSMPFPPNSKEINFDLEKLLEKAASHDSPHARYVADTW
jgi:hypothetical protein